MTEGPSNPYTLLGIAPQSTFEEVQAARQAKLDATGDDPIARSRVEAAYDSVLMDRLKERQQGRVSSAARSASQKETLPTPARPPLAQLPNLPSLSIPRIGGGVSTPGSPLSISLATGRERLFPLISHGVLFALALGFPGSAPDALLALAALITLVNLQRRNGKFGRSVGSTVLLLALGLGLAQLFLLLLTPAVLQSLPIQPYQIQAAIGILVMLLGALFLG
ncbi:MAG: CPP1-like family protein [Cyanobacteriota bacterium]|nr:CPP1-like family protein [Cyanobacteriota bacterium]